MFLGIPGIPCIYHGATLVLLASHKMTGIISLCVLYHKVYRHHMYGIFYCLTLLKFLIALCVFEFDIK